MESWARISTSDALPLLSPDFTNARVRAYAVKVIENEADDEELQDYLLQLVQALRCRPRGGKESPGKRGGGRGGGRGRGSRPVGFTAGAPRAEDGRAMPSTQGRDSGRDFHV